MEATNVNSIETGKWILETFAAWLLPRLTQMMLVSGRGLDSWTKLNKQTNKQNESLCLDPTSHTSDSHEVKGQRWSGVLYRNTRPVWGCSEVTKVTGPHTHLKEAQQRANQGQERNHNHASCVWFAASHSEVLFSASPRLPPLPPTPNKWF